MQKNELKGFLEISMGKIVLTSYISHGAPTSLVERTKIHDVYESLGECLKSAGWIPWLFPRRIISRMRNSKLSREKIFLASRIIMGFPEELHKFSYEAKNNTKLVSEIIKRSKEAGIDVAESKSWGLDHGAWLPLYFMFPKRDVKVVPVSITGANPQIILNLALRLNRQWKKLMVLSQLSELVRRFTGSILFGTDIMAKTGSNLGTKFDEKLIEVVASGDLGTILNIQKEFPSLFQAAAPEGNLNPYIRHLELPTKKFLSGKLFYTSSCITACLLLR